MHSSFTEKETEVTQKASITLGQVVWRHVNTQADVMSVQPGQQGQLGSCTHCPESA